MIFGFDSDSNGRYVLEVLFPLISLNNNVSDILATEDDKPYKAIVFIRWIINVAQTIVFMIIAIWIDNIRIHNFRGKDNVLPTVDRNQLDER